MSASTSVPLDNEVVMKRAPGRTIPVQGGKEGRRPEGLQVCCSETVSVPVPVCMHACILVSMSVLICEHCASGWAATDGCLGSVLYNSRETLM